MESINITLQVSIKDTDELIQQIRQQLDNTPILPDRRQPPPVENAPYSVLLGDGETRIAHSSGGKTYTDVVAILGLKRLNGVPQSPQSRQAAVCTSPHREAKRYNRYGEYYVYKDLKLEDQIANLKYLAEKLGVTLTIEDSSEVTTQ